jgi:hypothetical protein
MTGNAARVDRSRATNRFRRIAAIALAVACAGLLLEFATGVPAPTVPPGPIVLGAAAVLVAVVRWRWIPLLGVVVGLFLTFGAVASGTLPRLATPSPFGPFAGTWIQLVAQIVAVVAGIAAVIMAAWRGAGHQSGVSEP